MCLFPTGCSHRTACCFCKVHSYSPGDITTLRWMPDADASLYMDCTDINSGVVILYHWALTLPVKISLILDDGCELSTDFLVQFLTKWTSWMT